MRGAREKERVASVESSEGAYWCTVRSEGSRMAARSALLSGTDLLSAGYGIPPGFEGKSDRDWLPRRFSDRAVL